MADFGKMLTEHGFQAQHVTPACLESALEKHGQKQAKMFEEMLEKRMNCDGKSSRSGPSEDADGWRLYWWKKGAEPNACPRIVPSTFKLPTDLTAQTAWQLWWTSHASDDDASVMLPPIKACTYYHLPRGSQPRWKEWSSFFEECFNSMPVTEQTELMQAYKRRNVPLSLLNRCYVLVVPIVNMYRKNSKRKEQLKLGTILRNRAVAAAAQRQRQ